MCLIVHKTPKDTPLSKPFIDSAFTKNRDGWGIIALKPINKDNKKKNKNDDAYLPMHRLEVHQDVTTTSETLWKLVQKYDTKGYEYVIHFRHATHGLVNKANTHPFKVTEDIYFIHNGIVYNVPEYDKDMSDTWHFVDLYLKDLISNHPDPHNYIRSEKFNVLIEQLGGQGNRFAVVDPFGVIKFNEKIWKETTNGVCVSNSYAYTVDNPDYWGNAYYNSFNNSRSVYDDMGKTSTNVTTHTKTPYQSDVDSFPFQFDSVTDNGGVPFILDGKEYDYIAYKTTPWSSGFGYTPGYKSRVTLTSIEIEDFEDTYLNFKGVTKKDKEERAKHFNDLVAKDTKVSEVISSNNVPTTCKVQYQPRDWSSLNTSLLDVQEIDDLVEVVYSFKEFTVEEICNQLRSINSKAAAHIFQEYVVDCVYDLVEDESEELIGETLSNTFDVT